MTQILVGSAANDGTGDPLRTAFLRINQYGILNDKTINAAFYKTASNTNEAAITLAIVAAALLGSGAAVWVPQSMLPYNASLVTFNTSVAMLREGGRLGVNEVTAYGADATGVLDAGPSWNAARANIGTAGGEVVVTTGTYKLTTPFTYGSQTRILLIILEGVTITGSSLPIPPSLCSQVIHGPIDNTTDGTAALTTSDTPRSLVVGNDFGGPPRFQVGASGTSPDVAEFGYASSDPNKVGSIELTRYGGTFIGGAFSAIQTNYSMVIKWGGWDGFSTIEAAHIYGIAGENWDASHHAMHLVFATTPLAGTGSTKRWQISDAGHWWPFANDTYDIGNPNARVNSSYARRFANSRNVLGYGANIGVDALLGNYAEVTPTNGTAYTFNAPGNPPASPMTQRLTIRTVNTFGVLGVATFTGGAGGYRLGAAWVQPGNGFSRAIQFDWDGTNWIETGRSAVDVAN